jgi:hypothetical protein
MSAEKTVGICDIFLYSPHKCVYFAAFYINFSLPVVGGDRLEPYRRAIESLFWGNRTEATADRE